MMCNLSRDAKTPPRHPASVPNPPRCIIDGANVPHRSFNAGGTPRAFKVSGSQQFLTPEQEQDRNRRYKALAKEAQGHFVGPVDPAWFISHYLLMQEKINAEPRTAEPFPGIVADWTGLKDNMREADMYEPIVKGAREFLNNKGGFVDSHSARDSLRDDLSPDILNYMPLETALTSKVVDLSKAEYFIEVKNGKALDPFVDNDDKSSDRDPDYPFEAIADMRILTRGQILAYCTAIARSQFRTHVFGVIIIGTRARILRWDPSAMVVTSLFDYTEKENNLLAQFIWHYENASPHTRGHDTSVKSISTKVARKRFGTEIMGQVRERNPHHSHFCIMNISDRETEVIQHSHLISYPPPYQRISPFGRITRTLHAFDEETKEFVFVKDYWRVMADGMAKESDIYKELEKHKVPNIAPFGNGNDVMCEAWSVPSKKLLLKLVKTRHENGTEDKIQKHKTLEQWRLFRMSLRVIGDGLETFKSTKQLVGAIADAMEAHDAALFDARILHRDISVGNILIHGNRGLLIDWDLCFLLDGKVEGPRRAQRTGTWQFMSAAILQNPTKVHDISDDRESAFHVLTWTALCYGRHTQRRPDDLKRLLKVYDYSFAAGKYIEGGELKRDTLLQYKLSKEVSFNPPLDRLIKDLAVNLRARYIDIEPSARAKLEATKKKIAQFEQAPGGPEAHRDVLEALRDNCTDNPAFVLSTLMKQLETRGWLVKKMRKYLQESGWPLDDKVRPEGLHETSNSKKRSRDKQDDSPVVLEGQPKSKVEKRVEYADVSSSRTSLFRSGSSGLGRVMEEEED